jgi:phenylpyruvate tautomerase PptA (4-oxalocrotonate tautomerase family)
MPLYTILHVEPIHEEKMEAVAKKFSAIHSHRYKMPPSWVNVSFLPVNPDEKFYIGGKLIPGGKTRISGQLRPGESRTIEGFNALVGDLAGAYTEIVGGTGEELVYVADIAVAVKENGLVLPHVSTVLYNSIIDFELDQNTKVAMM